MLCKPYAKLQSKSPNQRQHIITQYGQSTCPSDQMTFHKLDTSAAEYQSDAEISEVHEIVTYIDTRLTKDMSTKSDCRVLPSIVANSASSNSLIKLDNLVWSAYSIGIQIR